MPEDALGERPRHAISRRRSARMGDASAAVAALEPEPFVELDAELLQVANPGRCLLGECRDRARSGQPPPGCERVLSVQLRTVFWIECRSDSALRERARRRENVAFREHEHVSF